MDAVFDPAPVADEPPLETTVSLLVCTTCRMALEPAQDDVPRSGARLLDALLDALSPDQRGKLEVRGVECLSNCKRGCTVALTGAGRWTYVYGDINPDISVADILDGATRYAATTDGLVPWRERPEIFRKNCIARVPFLAAPLERAP